MSPKTHSITLKLEGSDPITLQTGLFAPQANGAVTACQGDTVVLATVTGNTPKDDVDFLPLTIEYRERLYASGMIRSSRFVKREGKPADEEILTARLVDRSLRPVFPEGYTGETQIVITPLSFDGVHDPDILAIIAASAALSISDIPFTTPVGAVRIGRLNDKFVINPNLAHQSQSTLDLAVSGTQDSLSMIEAGAQEISEDLLLEALQLAHQQIKLVINAITDLTKKTSKTKQTFTPPVTDPVLLKLVQSHLTNPLDFAQHWATKTGPTPEALTDQIIATDPEELDPLKVGGIIFKLLKTAIRQQILDKKIRPDDRQPQDIRAIHSQVGLLPRTHGSALFQRGLTHVLSVVTLGSPAKEQLIENIAGESTKRYLHHYNMPPYASGETGRIGAPSRREIGHGALAERALLPVLPSESDFAYTILVVSEVLSSNGSTSQASVCGSTLALMDAGVPIKKPVAGIAMGLITDAKDKFITLSDIAGIEDFTGDMDFKVAGTKDGITAIQMDVKTLKITPQVLAPALKQAQVGRLFILAEMIKTLAQPRPKLSQYAPRIESLTIPADKIGTVIGSGGKTIREIQDRFGVEVDIEDKTEVGIVSISGIDSDKVKQAVEYIKNLTAEAEVGHLYAGTVKRLMDFGAFVEILPGQEGLVHVSNMGKGFVKSPAEVVKEGDQVQVKVYEIDRQGRINLTMDLEHDPAAKPSRPQRPPRSSSRFNRFSDHR